MSLKNLSLLTKVVLVAGTIGLVAVLGAAYFGWQTSAVNRSYQGLIQNDGQAPFLLARANRNLSDVVASLFKNAASTTEKDNADAAPPPETRHLPLPRDISRTQPIAFLPARPRSTPLPIRPTLQSPVPAPKS